MLWYGTKMHGHAGHPTYDVNFLSVHVKANGDGQYFATLVALNK